MPEPDDLADARECYRAMSVAELVELRAAFEKDAAKSPAAAAFCAGRLAELLAARVD